MRSRSHVLPLILALAGCQGAPEPAGGVSEAPRAGSPLASLSLRAAQVDSVDGVRVRAAVRIVVTNAGDMTRFLDDAALYELRVLDAAGREVAPAVHAYDHRSPMPPVSLPSGDSVVHTVNLECGSRGGTLSYVAAGSAAPCAWSYPLRDGERYLVSMSYRLPLPRDGETGGRPRSLESGRVPLIPR